jgi:hypothetical protein
MSLCENNTGRQENEETAIYPAEKKKKKRNSDVKWKFRDEQTFI